MGREKKEGDEKREGGGNVGGGGGTGRYKEKCGGGKYKTV